MIRTAAAEAERDQGQFTREIDAEQGCLRVLYQQPDLWWQRLALQIVAMFGLPAEVEHGLRIGSRPRSKPMHDNFNEHSPHMHEDNVEPDSAMAIAAYAVLITLAAAAFLVGWLCL